MNLKISPTYLDYMALLLQGRYLKKIGGDLTGDILAQHVVFFDTKVFWKAGTTLLQKTVGNLSTKLFYQTLERSNNAKPLSRFVI